MYNPKSLKAEEFISDEEIRETLAYADANKENVELIDQILAKAKECKGLTHREASVLLACPIPEKIQDMYDLAAEIKKEFYGNRIVLFAPLYLSNYCVNGCVYCPYHKKNQHIARKKLTQEEIVKEVTALQDMGHKRLAIEAGEDPINNPIEYILECIQTIYSIKHKNGAIRRVNVNIAATTVENYRKLKDAGIGTYILFQETYHKESYETLHPTGPKHNYAYHTEAMDRAMEGGIDDVGLGVLFGLELYRYEFAGLLMHAEHLEAVHGVGPHTISVPRIKHADDIDPSAFDNSISDEIFAKICALIRIAVPYTGMIISTRESKAVREKVLPLGVSQISGATFVTMVAGDAAITLFGLPITKATYSYSVIPVILMVWITHYIEILVDKITPKMVKLILNPTLVILISAPIALIVVGPIGTIIGNGLAVAINFLSVKLGFIIVGILAATFPFIVMTGMHHALTPIGLNAIATGGTDTLIFVSQVCSNLAQSGASLAVAVRSKDSNMKQLASAAGVSALMGITEPALYGVTLKLKRPVVAASIAAGIGGIVGGLLQVSLYIAQNCIMAIPAFIGEKGLSNLIYGIIMIVVSFVAAFVLTLIFGFEDVKAETEDEVQNTDTEKQPAQQNAPLVDKIELCAPVAGTVKALSDVPDKTFADKVLGDGAAIVPSEGKVYAPADGTVANIMDSKHGIMFVTESGAEILIHIGLDTVNLNGKYFKSHVSEGDKVKKGKLLVEFDMDAIKKEGYDLITPVVVTNISDYIKAVCMEKEDAAVNAGDKFLTIV